jgi:hypothetical protein
MLDPVRAPGIVQRHPELRWLVPVALIVAVVGSVSTSVSGVFREDTALSVTGPDQLIAQVLEARPVGYSGRIVAHVDLGLPKALEAALTSAAPAGTLLRGSHTLQYWYGGADRQRVAVVSQTSEQDTFRNGTSVWQWDTSTRIAQRSTLASSVTGVLPLRLTSSAALTPPQLAAEVLNLVGPGSDTTLRSGESPTDRQTYELVVHPDSGSSRIGEVRIEVDGRQAVPLGVQVFSLVDEQDPVLDVSFQTIKFAEPASQNFDFAPPVGARVVAGPAQESTGPLDSVTLAGTGWSAVAAYRSSTVTGTRLAKAAIDLLGDGARRVRGTWGKGRLLQTPFVNVLVTSKGEVLAGAVTADALYQAVG